MSPRAIINDPIMGWLTDTGLSVAALILFVLLVRGLAARRLGPGFAYALWALPIARLFLPGLTLPHIPALDVFRASKAPDAGTTSAPIFDPALFLQSPADAAPLASATIDTAGPSALDLLIPALLGLWLIGALIMLARLFMGAIRQSADLRLKTDPAPDAILRDAQRAQRIAKLKTLPEIRLGGREAGPMVAGLRQPVIVLPSDFDARFTPEQRRHVLLHEMMHIARGDLWAAHIMGVFRALNWPNPLIHWAWPRFRLDQEAACDAAVLRALGGAERGAYAETLVQAAQAQSDICQTIGRASPADRGLAPMGTGLALSLHHPIKERLMILGDEKKRAPRSVSTLAMAAVMGVALIASAPLSFADEPPTSDSPKVRVVKKDVSRWVTSDQTGKTTASYEMVTKDGVSQAYRLGPNGERTPIPVEEFMAQQDQRMKGHAMESWLKSAQSGQSGTVLGDFDFDEFISGDEDSRAVFLELLNQKGHDNLEITIEDDEIVAFEIDENGNRKTLDTSKIDGFEVHTFGPGALRSEKNGAFPSLKGKRTIFVRPNEDGEYPEGFFADGKNTRSFTARFEGTNADETRMMAAENMLKTARELLETLEDADIADSRLYAVQQDLERARATLQDLKDNPPAK